MIMNRKVKVFLIASLGVILSGLFMSGSGIYAEQNNPFKDKLPTTEPLSSLQEEGGRNPELDILETIELQGIIWGTGVSQAIISGEIYREGDVIESLGARISHIYKEKVAVIYLNKEYYLTIKKGNKEE